MLDFMLPETIPLNNVRQTTSVSAFEHRKVQVPPLQFSLSSQTGLRDPSIK